MTNENTVYTASIIEIDDGLGFIIPPEILKSLNIKPGDKLGFEVVDDYIVIKPIRDQEHNDENGY